MEIMCLTKVEDEDETMLERGDMRIKDNNGNERVE